MDSLHTPSLNIKPVPPALSMSNHLSYGHVTELQFYLKKTMSTWTGSRGALKQEEGLQTEKCPSIN